MSDPKYVNIGDPRDKVIEEGSELIREVTVLIQEICKARHFGMFSSHPVDQPDKPNIIRILDEMSDTEQAISKLRVFLLDNIRDIPELADELAKVSNNTH